MSNQQYQTFDLHEGVRLYVKETDTVRLATMRSDEWTPEELREIADQIERDRKKGAKQ